MDYWQLKIRRPHTGEEIYDLRVQSSVYAGDDLSNDICLDTTTIPAKLKLVHQNFRKRVYLRLSDEVIPTLKGQVNKKKVWKTPLYAGSLFEVSGNTQWKIGDADFSLEQMQSIPLAPLPPVDKSLENKHWMQSLGVAAAFHAAAFLVFLTIGLIYKMNNREINPADIQKVSIQTVQKAFEKPKPAVLEVARAEEAQQLAPTVTEMAKEEKDVEPAALSPKSAKPTKAATRQKEKTRAIASKLPTQKSAAPASTNIDSMGLLAIQSTAKPTKTNLDVAALAMGSAKSTTNRKDARVGLGLAKGESDFGIISGSKGGEQVAQLDGSGVESYQGGLGEKVRKGSFKGASIKLVRREIEIRGGLDPAVIRQIIEERLPEVRYCYETALLKQTNLQGKISASWTIQPDGSVSALTSESDEIKTNILHPCIKDQIKNWKFPAPKGGGVVHVKYPFLFSPVGS